jgi:hypothetical protein
MMPMKTRTPRSLRTVQAFDLITPAGEVHRFPKPTWLQRAATALCSFAEPAILLTVVLILAYSAGVLAESLQPLASDACPDQMRLQRDA